MRMPWCVRIGVCGLGSRASPHWWGVGDVAHPRGETEIVSSLLASRGVLAGGSHWRMPPAQCPVEGIECTRDEENSTWRWKCVYSSKGKGENYFAIGLPFTSTGSSCGSSGERVRE